jgi:hypothetical protein
MTAIAELACQSCGARTNELPRRQPDSMPKCSCGGFRQVVRIVHEPEIRSEALAELRDSAPSAEERTE